MFLYFWLLCDLLEVEEAEETVIGRGARIEGTLRVCRLSGFGCSDCI